MTDAIDLEGRVELLDENGRPAGELGKLAAHRAPGALHRGFSVFLFDDEDRVLLQRRAAGKYHFGGRWSNACCGHPAPGVEVTASARRRLAAELGVDVPLTVVGSFRYAAADPVSGLVEREDDTVLLGRAPDGPLHPNPEEVSETRLAEVDPLKEALRGEPAEFTPWLAEALEVALAGRRERERPTAAPRPDC